MNSKRHLTRVLKETKGNKVKAAKILGIDRRTLYRMAERFGMDLGDDAEEGSEMSYSSRRAFLINRISLAALCGNGDSASSRVEQAIFPAVKHLHP
ncbi:MAG: helix-turn-helix domain-containing protein [Nitrospiraceae bacterium]